MPTSDQQHEGGDPRQDIRFVRCQRCRLSMRVRVQAGNPDARLMRYSQTGEGLCASCAAASFLYAYEHIKRMLDEKPFLLLNEHLQQQFAVLMRQGEADASPTEINWQSVYENWGLPFPRQKSTDTGRSPS